jgi:hypothetical protein
MSSDYFLGLGRVYIPYYHVDKVGYKSSKESPTNILYNLN